MIAKKRKIWDDLVGRVYECGFDPNLWPDVIEDVRVQTGGSLSAMFYRDSALINDTVAILGTSGYPASALKDYSTYFASRDVRSPTISELKVGEIYLDDRQIEFNFVKNSEIFNDYFRPLDGSRALGANIFSDKERFCVLSVHRSIAGGCFKRQQVEAFTHLVPHIKRSLQVHRQFVKFDATNQLLIHALDRFRIGVIAVSRVLKVVHLNSAANEMMQRRGFPLIVRKGHIDSTSPKVISRLSADILVYTQGVSMDGSFPAPIRRYGYLNDLEKGVGVMISPLNPDSIAAKGLLEPLILIFLSDPKNSNNISSEVIKVEFGLSIAEAFIVAGLVAGKDLGAISTERGVTYETARSQLRSIFLKTATRSQTALVGLVSRGLSTLQRHQ